MLRASGSASISCSRRESRVWALLRARLSCLLLYYVALERPDQFQMRRLRHRQLIEECVGALLRFESIWEQPELAAEELRAAAHALGKVTGVIDTEDVLDALFGEFCIGK